RSTRDWSSDVCSSDLAHSKSLRTRISAGLLMFRRRNNELEVLLAHPGGPFFVRKDDGVWTIPKGEAASGEDLLTRAQIEFEEEEIGRASCREREEVWW